MKSRTIEIIERTSLDELFSAPRNERNASDVEVFLKATVMKGEKEDVRGQSRTFRRESTERRFEAGGSTVFLLNPMKGKYVSPRTREVEMSVRWREWGQTATTMGSTFPTA